MKGGKRREARYRRRKAVREAKRKAKLGAFDDFERIADFDSRCRAALGSMRGVAWKESVQRYGANALRNVAETRRKLLAGESVRSGFAEFTLRERGKTRRIKSVHISERVAQKSLCGNALAPLLSNTLIHDNGASVKGKGVHFALRRLVCRLSRYYRRNRTNEGYALPAGFKKFFGSIDHAVLFALLAEAVEFCLRQNSGRNCRTAAIPQTRASANSPKTLLPFSGTASPSDWAARSPRYAPFFSRQARPLHKRKTANQILRALYGRFLSDTRKRGVFERMPENNYGTLR
jgi:hypothetical protein